MASKKKFNKLVFAVHVLSNMQDVAYSRGYFVKNGKEVNKEL